MGTVIPLDDETIDALAAATAFCSAAAFALAAAFASAAAYI